MMAGTGSADDRPTRAAGIDDCWRRIGVTGNRSCPDLAGHRHCRNCPRYHTAARTLLDRPLADAERAHWASRLAAPPDTDDPDGEQVVAFRVGRDWLALDAGIVAEIATLRVVRSLPHRGGSVLGIVNVRGRIIPCLSLGALLHLGEHGAHGTVSAAGGRLLVFGSELSPVATPVDEVAGLGAIHAADRLPTSGLAADGDTVVAWQGRTLVRLDTRRLLDAVGRSLA